MKGGKEEKGSDLGKKIKEAYEKMCHLKHNTNYMITEGEWEEKVKLPLVFHTLLTVDKSCTFPQ